MASPEDLVVMKLLAGRPRDIEDVRAVLRAMGSRLDFTHVRETLALLEEALGQSDLLPRLAELRRDASRRRAEAPVAPVRDRPVKPGSAKRAPAKRKPPVRKTKAR